MRFTDPILCGFVWKHGEKDYSAWQVELSEEDQTALEEILYKYEADGCSVRNCIDLQFSDVF